MSIGEKIRLRRKELRLSQAEVAAKSMISLGYLSEIETGKKNPSLDTLREIASALSIPIENLISDKVQSCPKSEAAEMFARLMKKLAAENPDLIVHFRDLDKNIDNLTLEDVQGIADGIAIITGQVTEEIEKRMKRKSRHGDL